MKLFKKILAAFVCVFALVGLASCSTVNKIKKAFEKEGYIWTTQEVSAEAKEAGIDGIYYVSKDGVVNIAKKGFVIEFSAEDAQDAYNSIKEEGVFSDDFLSSIISSISSQPVVNGNCFILAIDSEVINIFKNA